MAIEMPIEQGPKTRLAADQKAKILSLAESLVKREDISSLCAYGSRVAGYAREDSDYDVIIVTKNPKDVRSAKHVAEAHEEEAKSPPIIVDETALLNEAKHPSAGEFVVGRLLNIYEPIVNAEFLRSVEFEYKKRVIAEELIRIQTDYGDFSSNLVIPYEYFLFDKLHKRAAVYPEAIYGFTRTYTCDQSRENLGFAIRCFLEAAESMASDGIIESTGDSIRIFMGKKRASALSNLFRMYPLTAREARRFAFHVFANRVGFEFKTKPVSKLRAIGKAHHPALLELDHPKKLLRLEEGVIFDDASKIVDEIARISGFGETYEYEEKKESAFISSSRQLEIWDDEKRAKFVLKHFPEVKSAKWALLNLWSLAAKKFNISPLSRLNREIDGARRVRELGFKTHRIVGIALDDRTLVTEYIEGVPLSDFVQKIIKGESTDTSNIERYALVLARMHKAGLVYGDTKPQNVLVCKGAISLLDLEQAVENGDAAWDLAEFLYFSSTHLQKEKDGKKDEKKDDGQKEAGVKLIAESFLASYRSENGSEVVAKAKSLRYVLPFVPVLSRRMVRVVRRALEKNSSSTGVMIAQA
jgi:tRNA A-37 threonylcarbamoyl transferase component Bud32/predicted nucleotidyltransferase